MRILVCGGRYYTDKDRVWRELDKIVAYGELWDDQRLLPHGITIIHGGAAGADALADHWAVHNYANIEEFPADWEQYGKSAGPIRNKQMLDEGKPDLVLAFPGSTGTAHMVKIAREAGIEVIEIDQHSSR